MRHEIVSYDIFETAIVRSVASPRGVYLTTADELKRMDLLPCDGKVWVQQRENADAALWRMRPGRYTIEDIHEYFDNIVGCKNGKMRAKVEIETEMRLWRPVPFILERIKVDRLMGRRVIFVSDGYFPASMLKEGLGRLGVCEPNEEVFSSCEMDASKYDGSLYRKLRERFGDSWVRHTGNHRKADGQRAIENGLSADLFKDGDLTIRERFALDKFAENDAAAIGEVVIGAARLARLSASRHLSPFENTWLDALSGVAAPVLACYAFWIARRARADGVSRLVFLSRDGYVPRLLVSKIAPWLETDYVFASRQAWHPAAFLVSPEGNDDWLYYDPERLTIDRVLRRLGLSEFQRKEAVTYFDSVSKDPHALLSATQRAQISAVIAKYAPIFQNAIRGRQSLAIEYLRRAFSENQRSTALVDLGWSGRLQRSLQTIIGRKMCGYYFGLHSDAVNLDTQQMTAFAFDGRRRGTAMSKTGFPKYGAQLLEIFAVADHGTVIGFQQTNPGVITPEFAHDRFGELNGQWTEIALAFFTEFGNRLSELDAGEARIDVIANSIYSELIDRPSYEEAEAFGSLEFDSDQGGCVEAQFAPQMRGVAARDLLQSLMGRPYNGGYSRWPTASARRSNPAIVALHFSLGLPLRFSNWLLRKMR